MKKFVLLVKSQTPIPAGARWITVNGGEGGGQAVLIQPMPDGSAKVIGGAGGSLNHLRLRSVKSKDTYKEEAAAKAKDRSEAKKEQTKADKAAGIHNEKQNALKDLKKQKQAAERGVIESVAKKAGWKQEDMDFPDADYAHLSSAALEKMKSRHHANLLSKAKDVIKQSREKLLNDPKSLSDLGIGEIPLNSTNPDDLSVADLAPVPKQQGGLGFNPDYKGRSEASGLSSEQLAEEAHTVKQGKLAELTPDQRVSMFERGQASDLIKKELEGIKEPAAPNADASLLSAKDALDLVKDGKRLADIDSQIKAAAAEINKSTSEPKAFVLESSDEADIDEKAKETILNDLRTAQTSAFLSEVGAIAGANPEETLGGHIGVGAYNSINSLALAVGGDALIDRSVVDVLGIAGAAQVLARRIHSDMTSKDVGHIADGIQDFHVNHYMKTSTEALKKSKALTDAAREIDLSGYTDSGSDLAVAQELNARRRSCIGDAQRILGQSLGEMEANAALVMAMKQGKPDNVQVSLGNTTPENAIKQVRALGLMPGDYTLEKVGKDTFLTVNGDGMDKLAKPISRDDVQQVKRNISIIRGDHDEDGWLPLGVANRPDLVMDVKAGVADQLAKPFEVLPDLKKSLTDYIGGRAADGDHAADIISDVQSAGFFEKVGADRSNEYRDALDEIAPLKDKDGKQQRAEALADLFDGYANDYVKNLGGERTTLNKQTFTVDQKSVDALHRALAETPEGTAAYKQIGELTNSDQRAIREFFHRNIAKESPESGQMRADLEAHTANEPERTSMDMFGDESDNPAWKSWSSKRDELATKLNASSVTWGKYIETMGGNAKAYESVQDMIRSKVSSAFVDAHNKMNSGSPLKLGRTVIRNNLAHLSSVDPEASAARLAKNKELIDGLRERSGGKYAAGSVSDKIAAAQEEKAAYEQAQMGFFSSDDAPVSSSGEPAPLGGDERHTLGHEAERQIAGMMGQVGQNFKAGQPTKLWNVSMSGKYAPQQRAIKLVTANKRVVLAAGAGSGKTNMMLGAHAHLSGLGKVKRSLMLVPSIVQGQFGGEALRLLEAGKFKTHIQPGAAQSDRIAAYKDANTHICVMTHQSFRDDMIHLAAGHAGVPEAEMVAKVGAMSPMERKAWAAETMKKEGIDFDASFVDEAHDTLNREGKENSSLSNVVEAVGHNTPYHVYASGDPIKNDASEIHSMLHKMDPERYADRAAFMRRYGADTIASKDALKREMARYMFPTSITPDVQRDRKVEKVELSDGQKSALKELNNHLAAAKTAHRRGGVDVEACRAISPNSFAGVPEAEHEAIAKKLQGSIGILKSSAINRIINSHPDNAKVRAAVQMVKDRSGKQGVIFARNKASVEQYKAALEKEGKRVVVITGADSSKDKDKKRRLFNPESGDAQADVLIASDAGAVGMNLQSGQYLIQHDVSQTAKTHSQRSARIDRIGQKNGIELFDLVANHAEEKRSRERLLKKYDLKNMMADPMDGLDDSGVAGAISARMNAQQSQDSLF
ncbi:helicase-related protein [Polynucleobacter sp.]|uniref:helicase-related protein n=1 Tax=Polynucleobacter sp. TaxID=2029855 RepID=UPI003F69C7B4